MQGLSTFASRSNLTTRLVGEPLRNTRCHEVVRVQVPFHQQDLPTNSWSLWDELLITGKLALGRMPSALATLFSSAI